MKSRMSLIAGMFSMLLLAGFGCGDNGGDDGDGDGDGNGGGAMICQQSCEEASDCGENADDWNCTDDGVCEANQCSEDSDCETAMWQNEGCEAGDCDTGYECVEHGDTTYCARSQQQDSCALGEAVTKTSVDSGDDVDVCGTPNYECNDGLCADPDASNGDGDDTGCESDDDCSGDLTCNDDGLCVCSSDEDCSDGMTCASF